MITVLSLALAVASCSLEPPKIGTDTLTVSSKSCSPNVFIQALSRNIGTVGSSTERQKLEQELRAVALDIHSNHNPLERDCAYNIMVLYHIGNAPPLFLNLTYSATYFQSEPQLVCVNRLSPSTNHAYPADYRKFPIDEEDNPPFGPQFLAPCFDADGQLVEYR